MSRSEDRKPGKYNSEWSRLQALVQEATNVVEILKGEKERGEEVFSQLQISPKSLMGTVVLETGGIFVDHRWVRFLGSGCERMHGNLLNWNITTDGPSLRDAFIVAYDVLGGVFAMNGGAFPGTKGNIFYFSPKSFKWRDLEGNYSQLFSWALTGNLEQFYHDMRWPDWEEEVCKTGGDQGIFIYPLLWSNPELPVLERTRRAISMKELWDLSQELEPRLRNLAPGTPVKINFT